ncbi:MAG: EamA family transporter, partial [Chloroflexota bacterium]
LGLIHLFNVYVVWSSTYLAIRFAVRPGAGFPPFTLGIYRFLTGAIILLALAVIKKRRLLPTKQELIVMAASGIMLLTIANGMVTWAEQRAESGLAAIIVASIPIWSAIIEGVWDHKIPSRRLSVSLIVGFIGIAILAAPSLKTGVNADVLSILALIVASMSWAFGSYYQARNPVKLHPHLSSAYQMIFGAVGFMILRILTNEPNPTPTTEAWIAYAYLAIFGSVIAFTSYITALQILPTNIVMTYAYVNPVLAVLLGWAILNEEITIFTIAGSLLVLIGVAGVFRDRKLSAEGS